MNKKKITKRLSSLLLTIIALSMVFSICVESTPAASALIQLFDGEIDTQKELYFNNSVIQKLPSTVNDDDDISVIIQLAEDCLLDDYNNSNTT